MTTINLAVEGEIATLTLNNPDKLNAINLAMWQQLSANMASISADSGIRCVVLRGAGDQAFAMGARLAHRQTHRALERRPGAALGWLQKPLAARKKRLGRGAVGLDLEPALNAPGVQDAAHFNGISRQGGRLQPGVHAGAIRPRPGRPWRPA